MKKEFINQDLVDQRLAGALPRIDVAGHSFIVDWRFKELRLQDRPDKRINVKELPLTPDGNGYIFFLHLPTLELIWPKKNMTSLPKDVVQVNIPNELVLDPIGVAREYGLKDDQMLATFPIQRDLVATITELKDTPLAELVAQNRAKSRIKMPAIKISKRNRGRGPRR